MKNLKSLPFILLLLLSLSATGAGNENRLTKENIRTKTEEEINARIEELTQRLEEIQATDISSLNKNDRKALKREIKEIKKEISLDDRITLSVGAVIIILLLLIIIL